MSICPHLTTTSRNVPIELWGLEDGEVARRIPVVPFFTCLACGASFYADGAWGMGSVPIAPPAPVPQESYDS